MKAKTPVRIVALRSPIALLAALALCSTAPAARAQGDSVTVSAAGLQRLVYSAQLHTQTALKPELEACLQVLLELQRRNPHADPIALAGVSSNALQRYRASAPAYVRTNRFRDEILAAYLDALRQVPARTNFAPVNLTLLNSFMLGPADYNSNVPPATLICSLVDAGNQRLLCSEGEALKRKALVDDCVTRAHANAAFATAMDRLLLAETGVAFADTPAQIIGNTNSPLHADPTMTSLLALSQASGDGSLTVSTNQVMNLFTNEMQTMWETIHTNLQMLAQINQSNPDLLAYLTNQAAMDANVQLLAEVQQGQPAKLACATAAVLVQSELLPVNTDSAEVERAVSAVGDLAIGIGSLCAGDPCGAESVLSGGLDLFNMFTGFQSPREAMADQISNIQTLMEDLNTNMNYRFDRVDQSLTTIFDTLNTNFSKIEISQDAQGRQIAQLNGAVEDIRNNLMNAQASLNRLESELFTDFNEAQRQDLLTEMNGALFYEIQNPYTGPMTWATYSQIPNGPENTFYTYATSLAQSPLSSPTYSGGLPPLSSQLAGLPLNANLNYIQEFLSGSLGQPTLGTPPLANPRDWFMGAYAYLQLAAENPMLFREKGLRLPAIISAGQNLTNFLGSLTFSGTNLNWNLCNALENCYLTNLIAFNAQVSNSENQYANDNGFALGTWRLWDQAAPRTTTAATELVGAPGAWTTGLGNHVTVPAGLTNVVAISAAGDNNLALKADGTVIDWGDAGTYNTTNVPPGLSNVVAIAAGYHHSLALKADGTVVGWGYNVYGEATGVPNGAPGTVTFSGQTATGVVAIAAGCFHSLILRANGTVICWGANNYNQINLPTGLTNIVAVSAGCFHSLALKADGTVRCWGNNSSFQTNVPASLSGIVAIAAGTDHCLALKSDGTVMGWGDDIWGEADGVVNGWGGLVTIGGHTLSNVVAIAAGNTYEPAHSLALEADGTAVGWGYGAHGQTGTAGVTNIVAIAGADYHSFLLRGINPTGSATNGGFSFVRAQIPARVPALFRGCSSNTIAGLGLPGSGLANAAGQLSGAKMLLTDVLELGMPYTLERDAVLHSFLFGTEPLLDTDTATGFLQAQIVQLQTSPTTPPQVLTEAAALGYVDFQDRLNQCLTNLQAAGQPEIPRLVGHTLRLLNLLRDAWTQPTNSPPPTLEIGSVGTPPSLLLYGEPYMRYTLQFRDTLSVPGWAATNAVTGLQDGQSITPPFSGGPQRFYRLSLPMP